MSKEARKISDSDLRKAVEWTQKADAAENLGDMARHEICIRYATHWFTKYQVRQDKGQRLMEAMTRSRDSHS